MSETKENQILQSFEIDQMSFDPPTRRHKWFSCLKTNWLTIATVVGVLLGGIIGVILKEIVGRKFTSREVMYIGFIGEIFLRMLKCLILPLIVSSLVSAVSGLDLSLSKRIAFRCMAYYLTTTFAAVCLGLVMVLSIRPGVGHIVDNSTSTDTGLKRNVTTPDTLLDLVRNMFPPNMMQACTQQTQTALVLPKFEIDVNDIYQWNVKEIFIDGTNILGLVVVSVVIGVALAQLGEDAKTLSNFFHSLTATIMRITTWVIKLSPVGVMFLVMSKIAEMDDIGEVLAKLGWYFATVIIGLAIQGFVVLPALYFVLTRKNPFVFLNGMVQAVSTGFGTGSSSAALPLTIQCLEDNLGVDPRVVRFAIPIGATINMDGTALYEAVAAVFIAQARGVDLTIGRVIGVSITATAAAIGAAGIPQAGLVTMVMVLQTVGLPADDVALILAVDWLLDRFRTAINIIGDAMGAGIVSHRSQKELREMGDIGELPPMPRH